MKSTGGIRIGWYHASWPLAKLYATSNELRIKVSMADEYIFSPGQIVSLERVGSIPFFTYGVKINHIVNDYPENIIFQCIGNPDKLIKDIYDQGFRPQATIAAIPRKKGFPIKWQAMLVVAILLNVPILLYSSRIFERNNMKPSPITLLLLMLLFIGSISLNRNKYLQSIFLKPGRNIREVKHIMLLIIYSSGLLSIVFSLMIITGAFN